MTGPTHALIGLASTVALARTTAIAPDALGIIIMLIGSLAPDIEGDGVITRPGKIFQSFIGWRVAKLVDSLFQVIGGLMNLIFGHRGFIHSGFIPAVLFVLAKQGDQVWLFWFAWGYLWHLVGDFFTVSGIPIFSPFTTKRFSGSSLRTGSRGEAIVATVLVCFTCFYGWHLLPERVQGAHLKLIELLANDE